MYIRYYMFVNMIFVHLTDLSEIMLLIKLFEYSIPDLFELNCRILRNETDLAKLVILVRMVILLVHSKG